MLDAFASRHLALHHMIHDVLHCLVFKEHPRSPPARCAFRDSASIYYLIRFGLSRTFRIYFRKLSRPLGIRLPAAPVLVAVCRRLVIYYTVRCSLSRSFFASFLFFIFTSIICARADLSRADWRSFPGNRRSPARRWPRRRAEAPAR